MMRPWGTVLAAGAVLLAGCGGGPAGVALGEEVVAGYTDNADGSSTTLGITVLAVEEGSIADLEASGLQFDPEEQSLLPYYVSARFENQGDGTVSRAMRVSLEDAEGNLISPTTILDFSGGEIPAGPCPNTTDGELAPGDAFEDCSLFLVDPGVMPTVVSFLSQTEGEEPGFVYWTIA